MRVGCDIHGRIEVRDSTGGAWRACDDMRDYVGRYYRMFAALFGVRDSYGVVPLAAQRDIPEDVAPETLREYGARQSAWQTGYHSASWVSWSELVPFIGAHAADRNEWDDPLISPEWEALFVTMERYAAVYGGDGVRLVVWFDS